MATPGHGGGGKPHATSPVEDLSIPDVRRCLLAIRETWRCRTPDAPVCLSEPVIGALSAEAFAHRFNMGHHMKRHQKAKSGGRRRGARDESDSNDAIDCAEHAQ